MAQDSKYVVDLDQVRRDDVAQVGGKNASLGEMLSQLSASGIAVPPGFATTADAYRLFLTASGLDRLIGDAMAAARAAEVSLGAAAADIRAAFERAPWPAELAAWSRDRFHNPIPGGESGVQLLARARAALDRIVAAHAGGAVAVVAHAGPIAALRCHLAGRPMPDYAWMLPELGEIVDLAL